MIHSNSLKRTFAAVALVGATVACSDDVVYPPPPDTFSFTSEVAEIGTFHGVVVTSASHARAVGLNGTSIDWDGTLWSDYATGTTTELFGMWAAPDETIFAVGRDGLILRDEGSGFVAMTSGTTEDLNAVAGTETGRCRLSRSVRMLRWKCPQARSRRPCPRSAGGGVNQLMFGFRSSADGR
jgi:hypothetical protein